MIIKNDGSVFRILGEYRQDDIIQKINSKW